MQFLRLFDRLKPKPEAHASGWNGAPARTQRWTRSLRRTGHSLVEMKVPRGLGASSAALLMLASVSYGAIRGGHGPEIVANVQDLCDDAANALGFRISEVALSGTHELSRERVLAIAGVTGRSSLLFLDAAKTRGRLVGNPWIAEATVLKLYPGRLRIEVKERKPFALWQTDGSVHVIAKDGTVLDGQVTRELASLPLVVGKGAEHRAAELLALIAHYPVVARQLQASVLVAERRWDLYLKDKIVVSLPELEPEQALVRLVDLDREKRLLSKDIAVVDLRLSDRVAVRLSDAAAAAREAALKAAEKAAKKKKGGEA
jgi:cell division protein FtsQ